MEFGEIWKKKSEVFKKIWKFRKNLEKEKIWKFGERLDMRKQIGKHLGINWKIVKQFETRKTFCDLSKSRKLFKLCQV